MIYLAFTTFYIHNLRLFKFLPQYKYLNEYSNDNFLLHTENFQHHPNAFDDKNCTEDEYYHVPKNYDKTENDGNMTLDNYILDEDIIRILQATMKYYPGKSLYTKFPALSNCLFCKPYPEVAMTALGYPKNVDNRGAYNN